MKSNKFLLLNIHCWSHEKKEIKYQRNILFSFFSLSNKLKEEDTQNCTDNRHWKNEKQVGMGRKKSFIRNKFIIIDLKLRSTNQNKTIIFANNHSTKQQQLRAFSFFNVFFLYSVFLCSLCILYFAFYIFPTTLKYLYTCSQNVLSCADNIKHNFCWFSHS